MQRASNKARAAIATLALGVVAAIVAVAARAPLSRSTPVDARSLQAPTAAVFMVIAGIGIVMLGAVAMFIWSGRRRKDDPPEHEPPPMEMHWIWKVIATLLPLAVGGALVVAAVIGSKPGRNGPRFESPFGIGESGSTLVTGESGPSSGSTSAARGFVVPSWLPWTVLGMVAVAILVGVVVLWLRRPPSESTTPEERATSAAVDAAIGALDAEADPRRAVIAAYGAMQRTLGEHGVARSPTEAPREYLERVLVASRANEREAKTLTGLFEEARYSTHPIPERLRGVALTALRSLQGRLRGQAAT